MSDIESRFSKARLEMLCDCSIFTVAMTLLVLELRADPTCPKQSAPAV